MSLIPSFIFEQKNIAEHTYYKIGGMVQYFALPTNLSEVQETLFFCQKNSLPMALLGAGSNSIYADEKFNGLVLCFEKLLSWHWETNEYLYVEAGVTNTEIAEICATSNRAGASWMYRMPGQIGGTVRMNARCYGGEISQIVSDVLCINQQGELHTFKSNEIFFGYKKTLFMESPHIVVGVRLYFPKEESAQKLIQHMHECEQDRHQKQHFLMPSCGSTFKNNYDAGKSSGKIFDDLGLKGKQIGQAAISQFHGNFIWNCGEAKCNDVLNLSAFMRAQAKQVTGFDLELEVQPVGVFSNSLYESCGMKNLGPAYASDELNHSKWVGLFYYPRKLDPGLRRDDNVLRRDDIVPPLFDGGVPLFSSFFINYNQSHLCGVPKIEVRLLQLISLNEAKKNPTSPFLKWETHCFDDSNHLFPLSPKEKSSIKKLWNYSVSELFLAKFSQSNCYLEFEKTPSQHHIALKFNDIRMQDKGKFDPNLNVQIENNNHVFIFSITFQYNDLESILVDENALLVQCALSLGDKKYLLAPYWKNKYKSPDFHQPSRYWKVFLNE